jgi:hypothetical protein
MNEKPDCPEAELPSPPAGGVTSVAVAAPRKEKDVAAGAPSPEAAPRNENPVAAVAADPLSAEGIPPTLNPGAEPELDTAWELQTKGGFGDRSDLSNRTLVRFTIRRGTPQA